MGTNEFCTMTSPILLQQVNMSKLAATAILLVLFTGQGCFGVQFQGVDLEGATDTINTKFFDEGAANLLNTVGQAGNSASQGIEEIRPDFNYQPTGHNIANDINSNVVDGGAEKVVAAAGQAGDSATQGVNQLAQGAVSFPGRKLSGLLTDATNTVSSKVLDGGVAKLTTAVGQTGDSTLEGVQEVAAGIESDMDLDYGMG